MGEVFTYFPFVLLAFDFESPVTFKYKLLSHFLSSLKVNCIQIYSSAIIFSMNNLQSSLNIHLIVLSQLNNKDSKHIQLAHSFS